jgi:hypothetical protein
MAATGEFHLYADKRRGKKPKTAPLAVVVADFFPDLGEGEHLELVHDPFRDQEWHGDELSALQGLLAPLIEKRQAVVESQALTELRKSSFEPWMSPLMSARCAKDRRLAMLSGLMELVSEALAKGGAVVYFAY